MKRSDIHVLSFEPLDNKVLVEPDSAKNTSILIPDSAKDKHILPFGTVRAVGPGIWDFGHFREMDLKVGDRVQVAMWQGQAVDLNGQAMICLERAFIIGKVQLPLKGLEVVKGGKN